MYTSLSTRKVLGGVCPAVGYYLEGGEGAQVLEDRASVTLKPMPDAAVTALALPHGDDADPHGADAAQAPVGDYRAVTRCVVLRASTADMSARLGSTVSVAIV